jgi:hypothetical protein
VNVLVNIDVLEGEGVPVEVGVLVGSGGVGVLVGIGLPVGLGVPVAVGVPAVRGDGWKAPLAIVPSATTMPTIATRAVSTHIFTYFFSNLRTFILYQDEARKSKIRGDVSELR